MTRFLMSLQDSVDLVEHAFTHAEPGDLFVRKAPACTIEVLARAVASLMGDDDPPIRVIGTRHGEKLHETLLSSEEMSRRWTRATTSGSHWTRGRSSTSCTSRRATGAPRSLRDYTSANTQRLGRGGRPRNSWRRCPRCSRLVGALGMRILLTGATDSSAGTPGCGWPR